VLAERGCGTAQAGACDGGWCAERAREQACASTGVKRARERERHGVGDAGARVLESRCRCWSDRNVSDAERVARACAQCRAEAGSVCGYWATGASAAQIQAAWACECRSRIRAEVNGPERAVKCRAVSDARVAARYGPRTRAVRTCAGGGEAWRLGTDSHEGRRGRARQYLGKDGRGGTCDAARPRRVRPDNKKKKNNHAGQRHAQEELRWRVSARDVGTR
jgi:hypothetical protein